MDGNIRLLLSSAQQYGVHGPDSALHQAFELLKTVAETKPSTGAPEAFGQDLYVICAEIAFQTGFPEITKDCLRLYFMKTPPANQFLCRAYLCQAQLLAPTSAESPNQLEKAVVYLLKAINFAKENLRYHFLVYNASVLYWQFCRPFLKPNYRQYLSISLHQVVKALDDIEDKDYEWRAQLMIALIECHVDAGRIKEAAEVSKATAEFTKSYVPHLYKQVLGLQVRHHLIDVSKLSKDIRTNADLTAYFKICKLKSTLEQKDANTDVHVELDRVLRHILKEEATSRSSSAMSITSAGRRTTTPGSSVPTQPVSADEKKRDRDSSSKGRKSTPGDLLSIDETPVLLLELARLCVEHDQPDLASIAIDNMKQCSFKDTGMMLEMEFLEAELMVKNLGEKQEFYTKSAVEVRLQAIKRLEEAIMNAVRHGDPNVIQAGCVTMWNICLSLVQPNLRQYVRKPLTLVAEALQDIESLLVLLRCQVHTELAKCEEDEEQIAVAMDHLKKAIALDDGGQYKERLHTALHRLQLRAELYQQPERPEDQAAMIIEQARKSSESGTIRMKRALLMRAGEALSPDAFLLVLDSESESVKDGGGRGVQTKISKLGAKAKHFQKMLSKTDGHLIRLGNENARERARLWADLAKTARKQQVWDVCRVASRYCLLYDDNRWNVPIKMTPRAEMVSQASNQQQEGTEGSDITPAPSKKKKSTEVPPTDLNIPHSDKDLLRMLAEIHFLNSEALIHLLRSEGVELNNKPIPPKDTSKHPKGYIPKKPEDDPDWITYCEWIQSLCTNTTRGFLRGAELGVELNEPWIVCSAAAYVWNYNNHVLTDNRHRELIAPFSTLLDALKVVGHAGETILLVQLCTALAYGYVKPWIPAAVPRDVESPIKTTSEKPASPKKPKSIASPKSKVQSLTVDPDGTPDIKKAVEVCEYAIDVTNGTRIMDIVPVAVRHPLLQMWVRSKQLISQQIHRSLGCEDDSNGEGQRPMTRCLVASEMLSLNGKGLSDFKEGPPLAETATMVGNCTWSDPLVELQIWTRLTELAFAARNHQLVMKCSGKALDFDAERNNAAPKMKKMDSHKYMVQQEMLSYASCLMGQSLMDNMQGKNAVRRAALEAFVNAARYGKYADNYKLVITAARHYWNSALPLVSEPIERQLLRQPLTIILDCITATVGKVKKVEKKEEDEETTVEAAPAPSLPSISVASSSLSRTPSDPDDDLTLRAAMYGVLFQSYADKGQMEEGLVAMDKAVADMPRTKHRLLIFKHRVMVKAKLGRNLHMDIAKFKDESEDYVAHMWRKVALCSKDQLEQLTSYQMAIEALSSSASDWQKVDYLLEFSEWLFVNEFPLQDCLDQVEWAMDILLNMKVEVAKSAGSAKRKRSSKKGKKVSRPGSAVPSTVVDTKTHTETSESEDEVNIGDFIPVKGKAVIGVPVANTALTVRDLINVKQLDCLIRGHIMLAKMAGKSSIYHADYCIAAYGYIVRLWQVCLPSAGKVMKELATRQATEQATQSKGSAKGKKGKDGKGKETETPRDRDRPKRKGPLDAMPGHPEDWASYDVPDEIREAFKEDHSAQGLNKENLLKPMLTMYYLDELNTELHELGFTHLCLPVLALAETIAHDTVESKTMATIYHLKSMEMCQELNLPTAVKYHEILIGDISISEEEQARSREEIAKWKEKQVQVTKEEKRVQESQKHITFEDSSKKFKKSRVFTPPDQKTNLKESVKGLSKHLSGLNLREMWTEGAKVLIQLGHYQVGRQMLHEALLSAEAFDDKPLKAIILQTLAQLSYQEANHGQVIELLTEAQKLPCDELFWLKSTLLLVEATLGDMESKDRYNKARAILLRAIVVFSEIAPLRPNKMSTIVYVQAMLEAKYASIQVSHVLDESGDTMKSKANKELMTACQRLQKSADQLLQNGYHREAIKVLQQHAGVLRLFACDSLEKEQQHGFLLQAKMILQKAVGVGDEMLQDIITLSSFQEMRTISLPLQREVADIKIAYSELLIDMFVIYANEKRQQQLSEARKASIIKTVEEFVSATPNFTAVEKEWQEMASSLGETALLQLTSAHNLSGTISELKAKSLYNLGRCLRMLGVHIAPDPAAQWDVYDMNLTASDGQQATTADKTVPATIAGDGSVDGDGEPTEETGDVDADNNQPSKYTKMAEKIKSDQALCDHYLAQASEVLSQCVQLALQKGLTEIVSAAALEMVEVCGQFDPPTASQYLAIYQSCQASQSLKAVLSRAQLDPGTSQQAALLHQRQQLLARNTTTNQSRSTLMKSIETHLQEDSEAWKHLTVNPHHMDLMKELPSNFTVMILQHSQDKSLLYGAVLDKHKSGGGGKDAKPKANVSQTSKSKIARTIVDPQALDDLMRKFRQFKFDVMQMLLKAEYQRSQHAQRKKMLENLEEDMEQKTPKELSDEILKEEQRLQDRFIELLVGLEDYLRPITIQLEQAFRPTDSLTSIGGKESQPTEDYMVILADKWLLELPLEAVAMLQHPSIFSLTRDFSLQMLYNRIHREPEEEGGEDKKKKDAKAKASKTAAKDKSKNVKMVPVDRNIPPSCLSLDTHGFRYIVDPYDENTDLELYGPIYNMTECIKKYQSQFTGRWEGIMGNEHVPSIGELEMQLAESTAFIFYGMEKFLTHMAPQKLIPTNLSDCLLIVLLDQVQTNQSFLRQSKVDVIKSMNDLSLERPVETAMLLSLTGVGCVIANQWHCTLADNASKFNTLAKGLLELGRPTGQTVRRMFIPNWKAPGEEEQEGEGEGEDGKDSKVGKEEKHKDDKHHKDGKDSKSGKGKESRPVSKVKQPKAKSEKEVKVDISKGEEEGEDHQDEDVIVSRHWYNMICYGLPNIVVT
ncbi:cilia- and flagella-associated protein 46-like isoform X2 [Glandiceps talaboti]